MYLYSHCCAQALVELSIGTRGMPPSLHAPALLLVNFPRNLVTNELASAFFVSDAVPQRAAWAPQAPVQQSCRTSQAWAGCEHHALP